MRKISKQKEYASMLRAQHSIMKKQQENKGSAPPAVKPRHVKEAEMKRKAVSKLYFICYIYVHFILI